MDISAVLEWLRKRYGLIGEMAFESNVIYIYPFSKLDTNKYDTCNNAARYGYLNILIWVIDNGRIDVLRWAFENGFCWNSELDLIVDFYETYHVLRWARENSYL